MSVIALKDKDAIYIASDSLLDEYRFKYVSRSIDNYEVFPLKGTSGVLMGHYGMDREGDLIKTAFLLPDGYKDEITFETVVRIIVPSMFKELKNAGYLKTDATGEDLHFESQWILVSNNKIYVISYSGSVNVFDEFAAISERPAVLMGSMYSSVGKGAVDRIKEAFIALGKNGLYTSFPIVYASTSNTSYKLIEE